MVQRSAWFVLHCETFGQIFKWEVIHRAIIVVKPARRVTFARNKFGCEFLKMSNLIYSLNRQIGRNVASNTFVFDKKTGIKWIAPNGSAIGLVCFHHPYTEFVTLRGSVCSLVCSCICALMRMQKLHCVRKLRTKCMKFLFSSIWCRTCCWKYAIESCFSIEKGTSCILFLSNAKLKNFFLQVK